MRSSDVEDILQKTLVEAKDRPGFTVLEETVAKTLEQVMYLDDDDDDINDNVVLMVMIMMMMIMLMMMQVMEIRQSLLDRIKMIRKDEIYIDPDQRIKQEEKLTEFRMAIMDILIRLVDKNAASTDHLKAISQDLLRFKISLGNEVMRILILPEKTSGQCRTEFS